jgi:hypothetical protein
MGRTGIMSRDLYEWETSAEGSQIRVDFGSSSDGQLRAARYFEDPDHFCSDTHG